MGLGSILFTLLRLGRPEMMAKFATAYTFRRGAIERAVLEGRSAGPNLRSGSTYNGDEERLCVEGNQNRPCKTLRRVEGKLRALESLGKTQENLEISWPSSRKLSAGRDPVIDMGAHQKSSRTL
ncbi:hypothetical protein TNIN_352701 [Trichonephila inaurata madagascariensis]|uniref:Uncharacterized protein n=1 Tax=Trichonephila inaurata madagascariensis TaxID=2747483 RepID=A0A8X7CA90_9ARAC|nr:hypothetical protein TNIN_352701 [Trichonephila inaurata madagascariensis]